MPTLQNTNWSIHHETSGSNGVLKLSSTTSGTYGANNEPIVWAEAWNGNTCAFWVVFKSQIDDSVIRIWGCTINNYTGTSGNSGNGMSALGNASPGNLNDTSLQNDNLTLTQQ